MNMMEIHLVHLSQTKSPSGASHSDYHIKCIVQYSRGKKHWWGMWSLPVGLFVNSTPILEGGRELPCNSSHLWHFLILLFLCFITLCTNDLLNEHYSSLQSHWLPLSACFHCMLDPHTKYLVKYPPSPPLS